MRLNKRQIIIDVSEVDRNSYEALVSFAEDNKHLPIGKLLNEWIEYTAWDVAAWYIGDDV